MSDRVLSTIRMEHGMPLLKDLDLGAFLGAQVKLQGGDVSALSELVKSLADAGQTRVFRKLAAVLAADDATLLAAESTPAIMDPLITAAALQPFSVSFQAVIGFFTEWGISVRGTNISSDGAPAKSKAKPPKTTAT